jgi:glycosyltransferase involved in cell wall biosynthesis
MNKVSVIVPTLGTRNDFLAEAISSISLQTLKPIEILLVNNGVAKINQSELIGLTSIPIQFIEAPIGAGAPQARNIGAVIASGEYLSFLDDDDLWGSTFLHDALKTLKNSQADCCLGRLDKLENGQVSDFMFAENLLSIRSFLVMNPGATGSNIVISRKIFREIGGFNSTLSPTEDRAIMIELLLNNSKICFSRSSQAIMRMHNFERLTVSKSMNTGFRQFHRNYRSHMGWRDRLYSNWHFRKEEFKNRKSPVRFISLLLLTLTIVTINRRPSQIWKHPTSKKD